MRLRLLDPNLAAVFGTPLNDCDSEQTIQDFVNRGWSEQDARTHINYAIERGAYKPEQELQRRVERPDRKREE